MDVAGGTASRWTQADPGTSPIERCVYECASEGRLGTVPVYRSKHCLLVFRKWEIYRFVHQFAVRGYVRCGAEATPLVQAPCGSAARDAGGTRDCYFSKPKTRRTPDVSKTLVRVVLVDPLNAVGSTMSRLAVFFFPPAPVPY